MFSKRKDQNKILNSLLKRAKMEIKKDNGKTFFENLSEEEIGWTNAIIINASKQKGVLSVLITSLVKKIQAPSKDVRLHQSKMEGGYSGRTLDTNIVTPFMHKHFQRYSMKESGWLTRSLEQPVPYNLEYPGEIRNKEVKRAFLQILNSIEEKDNDPEKYLVALFIGLEMQIRNIQTYINKMPKISSDIPIEVIVNLLSKHFTRSYHSHGASKLPVLAVYSLYQIMTHELARFKSKKLLPLKSHLTADLKAKSLGDVEVVNKNRVFFEVVEIKLGIPISYDMVRTIYNEKIKPSRVTRYYVLSSAEPYVIEGEKDEVRQLINRIREDHGCEVIINGLIPSIKYYLRLIDSTQDFLKKYNENLKHEIKTSSEIKREHFKAWVELLKKIETECRDFNARKS